LNCACMQTHSLDVGFLDRCQETSCMKNSRRIEAERQMPLAEASGRPAQTRQRSSARSSAKEQPAARPGVPAIQAILSCTSRSPACLIPTATRLLDRHREGFAELWRGASVREALLLHEFVEEIFVGRRRVNNWFAPFRRLVRSIHVVTHQPYAARVHSWARRCRCRDLGCGGRPSQCRRQMSSCCP